MTGMICPQRESERLQAGGGILSSNGSALNAFRGCQAYSCGLLAHAPAFRYSDNFPMATPCKKCGAEKTEDVQHGLLYAGAKLLGYRLRMCSRCHRLRLVPRHPAKRSGEKSAPVSLPLRPLTGACPNCGKIDYRRSRRTLGEHVLLRGPMVRCRGCRTRYPLPRPIDLPR